MENKKDQDPTIKPSIFEDDDYMILIDSEFLSIEFKNEETRGGMLEAYQPMKNIDSVQLRTIKVKPKNIETEEMMDAYMVSLYVVGSQQPFFAYMDDKREVAEDFKKFILDNLKRYNISNTKNC